MLYNLAADVINQVHLNLIRFQIDDEFGVGVGLQFM